MRRESLESFLSAQAAGQLDSQGEFTLDSASALEKLGHSQLAEVGLWVVKVAQAGVALGATDIDFQLDYSRTNILFRGTAAVDGADLARTFLSGELPRDSWKRHLVVGLRAFYGQKPKRLCWTDSNGRKFALEKGHLQVTESASRPAGDEAVTLAITAELPRVPSNLARLNYAFKQTMAEHAALSRRCCLCPVRIRVDGRLISQQFPPPPIEKSRGNGPFTHTAILLPEQANGLPIVVQNARVVSAKRPLPARQEPYLLDGLAILLRSNGGSRCTWIKDGALMEPREFEFTFVSPTGLRCAMDLYFNGADLETDLTEFSVRHPKIPVRRLKQALHDAAAKVDFSRVLGDNPLGWSPEKTEAADRQALTYAIARIRFRGME